MKLGALISGGMNSWFAASSTAKIHEIGCIIAENSDPIVELQAKAAELPIISSESLEKSIEIAQSKYKIEGIVSGIVGSSFQRERLERAAKVLKLELLFPIWHINEDLYLQQVMKNFHVIISKISAQGLRKEHLGLRIGLTFPDRMRSLNISAVGEDGKYDTIVLNCPLFRKKIVVEKTESIMENDCKGKLVIRRAILI